MTIRRLNYTGCQRVRRVDVQITMDVDTTPPTFLCAHSLDHYHFPPDAVIVIEAQAHWTLMRFDCATVSSSTCGGPFQLDDFDSPNGIVFRLKVIGTGAQEGLILGEAEGVRPATDDGMEDARSFLAVQPADLGDVVWRLSFVGTDPLLQVNERMEDWRSFIRRRDVQALLMPEIYRQLLREAFRNPVDTDAKDAWQNAVLTMVPPAVGRRPASEDQEDIDGWVDDAVRFFAGRHRLLRGLSEWTRGEA